MAEAQIIAAKVRAQKNAAETAQGEAGHSEVQDGAAARPVDAAAVRNGNSDERNGGQGESARPEEQVGAAANSQGNGNDEVKATKRTLRSDTLSPQAPQSHGHPMPQPGQYYRVKWGDGRWYLCKVKNVQEDSAKEDKSIVNYHSWKGVPCTGPSVYYEEYKDTKRGHGGSLPQFRTYDRVKVEEMNVNGKNQLRVVS